MALELTRRAVLAGSVASLGTTAGCLEYLSRGCESQSEYVLLLTAVAEAALRTEPIRYRNLSVNEQRLVRKTLETGRFEMCPGEEPDDLRAAYFDLETRVGAHGEDGYAYLRIGDRYIQIGLVISAVYHARTEHHTEESPAPAETPTLKPS